MITFNFVRPSTDRPAIHSIVIPEASSFLRFSLFLSNVQPFPPSSVPSLVVFQEKHLREQNLLGVGESGIKRPNNLTSGSAHIQLSTPLATFLRRNFLGVYWQLFSFSFAIFPPFYLHFLVASLTCSICFWKFTFSQHSLNSGFTLSFFADIDIHLQLYFREPLVFSSFLCVLHSPLFVFCHFAYLERLLRFEAPYLRETNQVSVQSLLSVPYQKSRFIRVDTCSINPRMLGKAKSIMKADEMIGCNLRVFSLAQHSYTAHFFF